MNIPRRRADWKSRLAEYLAAGPRRAWGYGANDCALFTAGAVAAMTGTDPAAAWRGRYGDLRAGIALIRAEGYRDHLAFVAAHFEEIAPAFAQVGDIAVIDGADGPALGIVQGEAIYALSEAGPRLVPLLAAPRAFRVP